MRYQGWVYPDLMDRGGKISLEGMKILLPCLMLGCVLVSATLTPVRAEGEPAVPREAKEKTEGVKEVQIGEARWKLEYKGVNADGSLVEVSGVRLIGGKGGAGMSFRAGRAMVLADRIELGNNYKLQLSGSTIQNTEDHEGEVMIYGRQFKVIGRSKTRVDGGQ